MAHVDPMLSVIALQAQSQFYVTLVQALSKELEQSNTIAQAIGAQVQDLNRQLAETKQRLNESQVERTRLKQTLDDARRHTDEKTNPELVAILHTFPTKG